MTAGSIVYRADFIPNPKYRGREPSLFSDELQARIRRHNVSRRRTVRFDGTHSRTEELTADYDATGPSVELRTVEQPGACVYCKQLLYVGFCVRRLVVQPVGGPPPAFKPERGVKTIAGFKSRRGEYLGGRRLTVWYTEDLEVVDPTGALLNLPGVPGFVTQTQESTDSDRIDALQRVTVTLVSSDPPPPEAFSVPFPMFDSVDRAREEDRRMLEDAAATEVRKRPVSEAEREMLVGDWALDTGKDKIAVAIRRRDDDVFTFRTSVVTAPPGMPGRETLEPARLMGRALLVESPPNFRLYRLLEKGQVLAQVGDDIFRFRRQ